jgi:hypothetical protein
LVCHTLKPSTDDILIEDQSYRTHTHLEVDQIDHQS